MLELILNIATTYLITGAVITGLIDLGMRAINFSGTFTAKQGLSVIVTWPFFIGILISDYLNGNF